MCAEHQCIGSYCSGFDSVEIFQSDLVLLVLLLAQMKKRHTGLFSIRFLWQVCKYFDRCEEKSSQELVLVWMWTRYDQYLVYCLNVPFAGHLCPTCWVNSKVSDLSSGPRTPDLYWIKSFRKGNVLTPCEVQHLVAHAHSWWMFS